MQSVILQPCGDSDANKHFVDTVQSPVPVARIVKHLSDEQARQLQPILGRRPTIPVWGVTPGKREVNFHKWQRIAIGDIAFFSRSGGVFATSTVAQKLHNKALALDLWQTNADGETWEYVYFLDEIKYVNIPYLRFNRAAEYQDKYVIQGFNVLGAEVSNRVLDVLDLRSERYQPAVEQLQFRTAVETAIANIDATDAPQITSARVEQGYLRKHLFQNDVLGQCCMCGRQLPVDLLVASHIKKRSECAREERLDYQHVVAPMCLMGCDALFERGYVVVKDGGRIVRGRVEVSTEALEANLARMVDRQCASWTPLSAKYFAWHRNRFVGR